MKRKTAEANRLPIIGKFVSFAVAGVPPHIMGIGPAYAIPKALEKAGITKNQVDVYEINESEIRNESVLDRLVIENTSDVVKSLDKQTLIKLKSIIESRLRSL
jgi:hypothetical protein